MKLLTIGQAPTEIGGNYSTGMGKVVYELSRCKFDDIEHHVYGININSKRAHLINSKTARFHGYKILNMRIIPESISHAKKLFKELKCYSRYLHYSSLRALFYRMNFKRIIDKIRPDIIHIHSINQVLPLTFANTRGIPIILTCHGIFNIEDSHRRLLYMESLKHVDIVTGLTDDILNTLLSLGVDKKRIKLIPNGVDIKKFRYSQSERKKIRSMLNISDETLVFMTVASLQQRKGQLEFLKDLAKSGLNFKYLLAGLGSDKEAIKTFARENRIEDRIEFLGYINAEDLYSYYSATDIYAHVSLQEGQALSEIEAFSTGLRIIVNKKIAKTIVNPEMDDYTYHIVDVGQINWDEVNKWYYSNNVGRNSKQFFDWQNIAVQYNQLYHSLLNFK